MGVQWYYFLAAIPVFGLLVLVHELGHFITAKWAGIRVEEFGIGFPPRAFGIKRGETIYSLNWLPIGGFVRLEGEDGDSEDPRSFVRQSLRTRLVILMAGVVMNFLLAWLIFATLLNTQIGELNPGAGASLLGI